MEYDENELLTVVLAFQIKAIRNRSLRNCVKKRVVLAFQIKAIRNAMFAKHCVSVRYNMFLFIKMRFCVLL